MSEPSMKYSEVWKDQRSEQSHPFTQKKRLNRTLLSRLLTPLGLTLVAASISGAYYHQRCYTEAQEPAIQMHSDIIDHLSTGTARDLLAVKTEDFDHFAKALNLLIEGPYTHLRISIFIWSTGAIGLEFALEQWQLDSNGLMARKSASDYTSVTLDNCTIVKVSQKTPKGLTKAYGQCLTDIGLYVSSVKNNLPSNVTWNQMMAKYYTADQLTKKVQTALTNGEKVSGSQQIALLQLKMPSQTGPKGPPQKGALQKKDGCDGCACVVM